MQVLDYQNEMITELQAFEKKTLTAKINVSANTAEKVESAIKFAEDFINNVNNDFKINEVDTLIYDTLVELQSLLFLNRQLVFLTKDSFLLKDIEFQKVSDFEEFELQSFGFLLIIEDEFIGERGVIMR